MTFRRIRWAWGASVLALAACGGGAADDGPRNLLLVVLDTTRADYTAPYGAAADATPTLRALAERGLTFREAYSHSSLTPVSTGSLLTGVTPNRHGIRGLLAVDASQTLREELATLPELFTRAGRRTAAFVSAPPIGHRYGLDRGFEHYSKEVGEHKNRILSQRIGNAFQRRADETLGDALAWLDENGSEPFAAMVHFFDAHDASIVPPREFLEEHLSFPLPEGFEQHQHLVGVLPEDAMRELYAAEILYMDGILARLLERVEELGVLDDTVVVVVADHGEGLGAHDFWTHGLLWGEQLRVPLVLAGPGLPRGVEVGGRARLVDVLPTLCELFDVPVPGGLDGSSLLPWTRGVEPERRDVYAEVHNAEDDSMGRAPELYSLTVGRWKYVHAPASGEHRLFDLDADPGEEHDLFDPSHEMVPFFPARLEAGGVVSGSGTSAEGVSDEYLEMLEDLGYL
ncbi:MAG: sulfatase [Planctomycetota bacterium]